MAICSWATLARVLGIASFLVLMIGGVLTIISLIPLCWGVGAYMLIVGIFVGIMETPFIFEKIECTKGLTEKLKKIRPIHRAVLYVLLSILIFFCFGISSLVAAILLIITGIIYFMVWMGPRGAAAKPVPQDAQANLEKGEGDKEQLIEGQHEEEMVGGACEQR